MAGRAQPAGLQGHLPALAAAAAAGAAPLLLLPLRLIGLSAALCSHRLLVACLYRANAAYYKQVYVHVKLHFSHFLSFTAGCLQDMCPALDPPGLDLLGRMLVYDPQMRITARQALAHPFFNDIADLVRARAVIS